MGEHWKRTLTKLKWLREELSELFCSKKVWQLAKHSAPNRFELFQTVFELFIRDVFRELFNQLRSNDTSKLSELIGEPKLRKTRGSIKGLLPLPFSRTKSKSKSVEHTLIKGYNWLLQMDLMPGNIETMTQTQINTFLNYLNKLYITDSSDLFALFF